MFRFGLWLKMRFIAMSMVSWSGILVKRLVSSCETKNLPEGFAFLEAHRQISKKRCFEKYCSYDQVCQFSVLEGTPWRSYLENLTIDDKFINKRVFSSRGYTLTELFRKPDNWRKIYKQTSSTFYTSNDVPRRKNY